MRTRSEKRPKKLLRKRWGLIDMKKVFGYCDLHDRSVNKSEFKYKGCWGCHHFSRGDKFLYVTVKEASNILDVSESTIRRWIKKGKLEGYLFKQIRSPKGGLPAPNTYFIKRESVESQLSNQA